MFRELSEKNGSTETRVEEVFKRILSVLWIRDLLIRMRIHGSLPLTYWSRSCFFVSSWKDTNKKLIFLLLTYWRFIYVSFQKFKKKSQNKVEIKVFLLFCLLMRETGSVQNNNGGPDPGGPHYTEPDLRHRILLLFYISVYGNTCSLKDSSNEVSICSK
jgi:hypothetical protein